MAYYIKSQNVFGNDTYIKGEDTSAEKDLRWTEDFSERKVFPTLYQAETVINNTDETTVAGIHGMTYKTTKWRKAIIVDNDIEPQKKEPQKKEPEKQVKKGRPDVQF
tara:strand:+ start:1708 stop:2028 length:321 start_codon:yes stop_codon:yes gene_type:complete